MDCNSKKAITRNILILVVLSISVVAFVFINHQCHYINASEQHRNYAKEAIRIADSYLDYECTAREAYYNLKTLQAREDELPDTDSSIIDSRIESKTSSLSLKLLFSTTESSPELYNEILSIRNELAELARVKKR